MFFFIYSIFFSASFYFMFFNFYFLTFSFFLPLSFDLFVQVPFSPSLLLLFSFSKFL